MKKTVHIIDDDPEFRRLLARVARKDGWDVVEYGSGIAFLDRLDHLGKQPLILLDILMPNIDGIEVINTIGRRASDSVLFVMTGGARANAKAATRIAEAIGIRVAGTLHKPMSIAEIQDALRQGERNMLT